MKTVTVSFVVEDDEKDCLDWEIQEALEKTGLNAYTMLSWEDRESRKWEENWYRGEYKVNR